MNFFNNFIGHWITKKNVFILKYNTKHIYEEKIKITINKNKDINNFNCYKLNYSLNDVNNYSSYFNLNYIDYYFNKKNNTIFNKYKIQKISQNLLKINANLKNHLIFVEYIYFINKNFNTSVSFIKKNNEYLVTIFTSYIKIKNS